MVNDRGGFGIVGYLDEKKNLGFYFYFIKYFSRWVVLSLGLERVFVFYLIV